MRFYAKDGSYLEIETDVVSEEEFEITLTYFKVSELGGEGSLVIQFKSLCYGSDINTDKKLPYVFFNSLNNVELTLNRPLNDDVITVAIRPFNGPEISKIVFTLNENHIDEIIDHLVNLKVQLQ
jgi:hypothetical protein